jgi:alpha-L-fucosidase
MKNNKNARIGKTLFLSLFLSCTLNSNAVVDDIIPVQNITAGDTYQLESVNAKHLISMEGISPNPTFNLENTTYAMIPWNCWHTSSSNNAEAWLLLDLGEVVPISKMHIWNLNQQGQRNRDIRDITISCSSGTESGENASWQELGNYVIPQTAGDGLACKAQIAIDFNRPARFVRIQANSSYGDSYWGLGKIILLRDHSQSSAGELALLDLKAALLNVKVYKFYHYTDVSWQALASVIETVQALLDNESDDLEAINEAKQSLLEAETGLETKENLLAGSSGSANESYGSGYEAQNALDGQFDTRWASTLKTSFWYKIDTGSAKNFNQLMIFETPPYAGRIYQVIVSVSNDGINWIPWREKGFANYYTSIVGEAVSARYIKLDFPDCSSEGINIDEIMAFNDVSAIETADPVPYRLEDPAWIKQEPATTPNIYQIRKADLKYGMFIHYGMNTFAGQEWTDGTYPPSTYHPDRTKLDPESWVKAAYEGGMNFVVLVAKHHEGFAIWNTSIGAYNINYTGREGDKRDIVKEVADACKKYGIKMGLYYSAWDRNWDSNHSMESMGFNRTVRNQEYNDYALAQISELLDGRYGEICELWIDGAWVKKNDDWEFPRLYNTVKTLQPACQFGINCTIEGLLPNQTQGGENIYFFPSDFRLFDPNFTRPGANADPKIYTHDGKEYYLPFEATICINNSWFWTPSQNAGSVKRAGDIKTAYNHMVEQKNTLVINLSPSTDGVLNSFDVEGLYAGAHALGIARGGAVTGIDGKPVRDWESQACVRGQKLILTSGKPSDAVVYDVVGRKIATVHLDPGIETRLETNVPLRGVYIVRFIGDENKNLRTVKIKI